MAIYEKLMGNPFVDAGVCGISEWLGLQPEEITREDLEQVVEEIVSIMKPFDKLLIAPVWNRNRIDTGKLVKSIGLLIAPVWNRNTALWDGGRCPGVNF